MSLITLTLAHSPDPDDAFMWWPIQKGKEKIDCEGFVFDLHSCDIETLNKKASSRLFDITALSCATWPKVSSLYGITGCGASIGDGYGPKVVSRKPISVDVLSKGVVAIPGFGTTAAAAFQIFMQERSVKMIEVPFEKIGEECLKGSVDAGVVIHEEQLTYASKGLYLIEDLGKWWKKSYKCMLPLGLNCVAIDLEQKHGKGTLERLAKVLKRSIAYAMAHPEIAMDVALAYGRGISSEIAKDFVDMYVNKWTLDFDIEGQLGIEKFYKIAANKGIFPLVNEIKFIR